MFTNLANQGAQFELLHYNDKNVLCGYSSELPNYKLIHQYFNMQK